MALRQPQRLLLSWLGTASGRRLDSRVLDRTGHSPYSCLYGKDLGAQRSGYRPPMNLTTIGRRTGRRHTVALAYFPIDGGWAVVGSAHGSPAASTDHPHGSLSADLGTVDAPAECRESGEADHTMFPIRTAPPGSSRPSKC